MHAYCLTLFSFFAYCLTLLSINEFRSNSYFLKSFLFFTFSVGDDPLTLSELESHMSNLRALGEGGHIPEPWS